MKLYGIIPARFASTRFPGKPLVNIANKTMIQRVWEQAKRAELLSDVWVATDDQRICDHVRSWGGQVLMTSADCLNGTERCSQALQLLQSQGCSVDSVMNIQGDEPFINPADIDALARQLTTSGAAIATLAKPISQPDELFNPNVVKLVFSIQTSLAHYFSRQAIPFCRDLSPEKWLSAHHNQYFKHIGLYAYRSGDLLQLAQLPESPLESLERLEQLRWLEAGYSISVAITERESYGIDSPEDLSRILDKIHLFE